MSITKNTQTLYTHGIDLERRRLYLLTEVDEMTVSELIMGLHVLQQNAGEIEFWICSGGGELEATLGLYDTMQRLDPDRTPIHTIATGQACSAALLLLAAGHKRSASENCWAMAHTTHGIATGDSDGLAAQTEVTLSMTRQMWYLLSLHTKKTAKQWQAIAKEKRECWMTATDMKDYGVIDNVLPPHANRKFVKREEADWMPNFKPKTIRKKAPKTIRKKAPAKKSALIDPVDHA
jgi:ATP-dependent Clp endopeptidase proteolytic subunit ClpP